MFKIWLVQNVDSGWSKCWKMILCGITYFHRLGEGNIMEIWQVQKWKNSRKMGSLWEAV